MKFSIPHAAICVAALVLIASCAKREQHAEDAMSFATPEEAVSAFVTALTHNDKPQLERLLGPGTEGLLSSGDEVADRAAREAFLARFAAKHQLVAGGPDDLVLQVGSDAWPLPIPLIRSNRRWSFDGAAGAEEMVLRRIGRNELRAIAVVRGYVDAQKDYAASGHDGEPAGSYAQRLASTPGKQDGLFWRTPPDAPPSPLGPLVAAAAHEGYKATGAAEQPYHGYRYRMLFAQGPSARGGERSYLIDGKLRDGFALVAYPANYGASGVMTFIVNQDGTVWQRDLGEDTPKLAAAMKSFDPDQSWIPLAEG